MNVSRLVGARDRGQRRQVFSFQAWLESFGVGAAVRGRHTARLASASSTTTMGMSTCCAAVGMSIAVMVIVTKPQARPHPVRIRTAEAAATT